MRLPEKNIGKALRLTWLLGSTLPLVTLAQVVSAADPFAASVLACAAESDRDRRLDCYDRVVASFTASNASPAAVSSGASVSTPTNKDAGHPAGMPRHLTARVASIDYYPTYVVVHLDNNQVWQQVSEASGDPGLHVGAPVSIDKQMGSYWLAGSKGNPIQVKLKSEAATP